MPALPRAQAILKTMKIKQKIEKLKKDFNNRLTIGCMVCI